MERDTLDNRYGDTKPMTVCGNATTVTAIKDCSNRARYQRPIVGPNHQTHKDIMRMLMHRSLERQSEMGSMVGRGAQSV